MGLMDKFKNLFTDEEIIIQDHTSITKVQYQNIKQIKEKT